MILDAKNTTTQNIHKIILGAIAPRPIAFVSTVDKDGRPNLAPFSFFNAFGANPPILVFSPARRGKDNTTKHTFDNIKDVPEVVINVVNYNMVHQMSLASSDFPQGENEFVKAGFTALSSETVRPDRVQESPVQFECKVLNIIETGDQGGAGNLVICEILKIHVDDDVLDENNLIDVAKIDHVGRLGGDAYVRVNQQAIFEVEKPLSSVGIGVDVLPEAIRNSHVLSGNDLGRLGNLKSLPTKEEIQAFKNSKLYKELEPAVLKNRTRLEESAKQLIQDDRVEEALLLLYKSSSLWADTN